MQQYGTDDAKRWAEGKSEETIEQIAPYVSAEEAAERARQEALKTISRYMTNSTASTLSAATQRIIAEAQAEVAAALKTGSISIYDINKLALQACHKVYKDETGRDLLVDNELDRQSVTGAIYRQEAANALAQSLYGVSITNMEEEDAAKIKALVTKMSDYESRGKTDFKEAVMLQIDNIMSNYSGYENSFNYSDKQKAEKIYTKMEVVQEPTKAAQGVEFFMEKGSGILLPWFSWIGPALELASILDEDYNPEKTLQPGDVGIIVRPSSYNDTEQYILSVYAQEYDDQEENYYRDGVLIYTKDIYNTQLIKGPEYNISLREEDITEILLGATQDILIDKLH